VYDQLDAVMSALGHLQTALLLAWVTLNAAAEFAHAWRSKTARSLANVYAVSFGLSIVGLFYVFVVCAETPETSLFWILINRAILYMAICLIGTHACVRGMSLVLDLFGVDSQHYLRIGCAKCAKTPLRQFLVFFCIMGVIYVWTIVPYVLLWVLGGK
jgi:hypothetical protein